MSSDKTEQATPKRLREAREKGDICKSQDIPSVAIVFGIAVYLIVMGPSILQQLLELAEFPMLVMHKPFDTVLGQISAIAIESMLRLVVPFVCFVMFLGLVANIAQVGFLFAPKAAMPKLENLSPTKWFKKIFSMKNLFEFIKNIVKVVVLSLVVYYVLKKDLNILFQIESLEIFDFWATLGNIVADLLMLVTGAFGCIAALDFLYQKWKYNKDHMMSKEEIKQEYKEMEGDPHIKGKRRELLREMLTQDSLGRVRKAKVIVTNPTHFAIALDYEKGKTPLPLIVAKGEGYLAKRIIKIAEEEGIPIMRNVPLAQELFSTGTENSYIPSHLIKPVAEVLRWVQSLQK